MSDVTWVKVATGIFDDDKIKLIEAMPRGDTALIIWFKILCLSGSLNAGGDLVMTNGTPYTARELSVIFRKPIKTVQAALDVFQRYDMINVIDGIINITNWEKHQNIEGLERIRELTKNRVANYRARNKSLQPPVNSVTGNGECNVTVTQGNATDKEQDKEQDKDIYIQQTTGSPVRDRPVEKVVGKTVENSIIAAPKIYEVTQHFKSHGSQNAFSEAMSFIDYNEDRHWQILKNFTWQQAADNWLKNAK